jgi:hypothetical protein
MPHIISLFFLFHRKKLLHVAHKQSGSAGSYFPSRAHAVSEFFSAHNPQCDSQLKTVSGCALFYVSAAK